MLGEEALQMSLIERIKLKDEMLSYTLGIRLGSDVRIDMSEIIYSGSGVFRSENIYDFDESNRTGLGYVRKEYEGERIINGEGNFS